MNHCKLAFVVGLSMLCAASFAATKITDQQEYAGGSIPRPATIWVYDLAATPSDVPSQSALAEAAASQQNSQTDEQIAAGRKVGAAVAADLINDINAMGMTAAHADATTQPQINDLVIQGYLVSVKEGDKKQRIAIGFGKGDAELQVAVEGFRMTDSGLQKLGGGSTDATGSKAPGGAIGALGIIAMHNPLGLIVSTAKKEHDEKTGKAGIEGREKDTADEIAGELKKRFQAQGWISE